MHDLIKRSYFYSKFKYSPSIDVVDIGYATYPDCKQAMSKVNQSRIYMRDAGYVTHETLLHNSYIYAFTFIRRFYPKRLTVAFRLYILISMCVPWESNPQPFALLMQCSTTEPHRNTVTGFVAVGPVNST